MSVLGNIPSLAQLVGALSRALKVVAGSIPGPGTYGRQPINVSLSHRCFFLSRINKNISLGKDFKK